MAGVLSEAVHRWLKKSEIIDILTNYQAYQLPISTQPPVQPESGSVFLFDKKVVRRWRADGHAWKGKTDRHEKLKVKGVNVLNCCYAHHNDRPGFHRRAYWLLEQPNKGATSPTSHNSDGSAISPSNSGSVNSDIVLVHYFLDKFTRSRGTSSIGVKDEKMDSYQSSPQQSPRSPMIQLQDQTLQRYSSQPNSTHGSPYTSYHHSPITSRPHSPAAQMASHAAHDTLPPPTADHLMARTHSAPLSGTGSISPRQHTLSVPTLVIPGGGNSNSNDLPFKSPPSRISPRSPSSRNSPQQSALSSPSRSPSQLSPRSLTIQAATIASSAGATSGGSQGLHHPDSNSIHINTPSPLQASPSFSPTQSHSLLPSPGLASPGHLSPRDAYHTLAGRGHVRRTSDYNPNKRLSISSNGDDHMEGTGSVVGDDAYTSDLESDIMESTEGRHVRSSSLQLPNVSPSQRTISPNSLKRRLSITEQAAINTQQQQQQQHSPYQQSNTLRRSYSASPHGSPLPTSMGSNTINRSPSPLLTSASHPEFPPYRQQSQQQQQQQQQQPQPQQQQNLPPVTVTIMSPSLQFQQMTLQQPQTPSYQQQQSSSTSTSSQSQPHILDFSPSWDYIEGGCKVLLVLNHAHVFTSHHPIWCVFGETTQVPTQEIAPGVHRLTIPATSKQGLVPFYLTDGITRTRPQSFEYRTRDEKPSFKRESSLLATLTTPHPPSQQHSSHERAFIVALVHRLMELDEGTPSYQRTSSQDQSQPLPPFGSPTQQSQSISSSTNIMSPTLGLTPTFSTLTSFSLLDIRAVLLNTTRDDLLEGLILTILRRALKRGMLTHTFIHKPDAYGRQLIHYIAGLGYTQVLQLLVNQHATVDAMDHQGRTPLHLAVLAGDGNMVSALLSMGADDTLVDHKGCSALALADRTENSDVVDVFLDLQTAENPTPHDLDDDDTKVIPPPESEDDDDTLSGMATPDRSVSLSKALGRALSSLTLEDMGIDTSGLENPAVSDQVFAQSVRRVQRKIRWWMYRRHAAAQKLQAATRGMLVRRNMKRLRDSALLIQSLVRQRLARREYQKLKQVTRKLQEDQYRNKKQEDEKHDTTTEIQPVIARMPSMPSIPSDTYQYMSPASAQMMFTRTPSLDQVMTSATDFTSYTSTSTNPSYPTPSTNYQQYIHVQSNSMEMTIPNTDNNMNMGYQSYPMQQHADVNQPSSTDISLQQGLDITLMNSPSATYPTYTQDVNDTSQQHPFGNMHTSAELHDALQQLSSGFPDPTQHHHQHPQ